MRFGLPNLLYLKKYYPYINIYSRNKDENQENLPIATVTIINNIKIHS